GGRARPAAGRGAAVRRTPRRAGRAGPAVTSPEALAAALQRARTHPFQTALTLVGLVVGTASMLLTASLGVTGQQFVMSQIEGVGSHLIWAIYDGNVNIGVAPEKGDRINGRDVEAFVARSDLFSAVTPLLVLHGQTPVLGRTADLVILGTTPNYPDVRKNL